VVRGSVAPRCALGRPRPIAPWFGAIDLVDFVKLVSAGADVTEHCSSDELVRWALVRLSDGRRLLLSERTYREGTKVLTEPSDEELLAARRHPWAAWNTERAEQVAGIEILRGTPPSS
jgi:hypothetical protein